MFKFLNFASIALIIASAVTAAPTTEDDHSKIAVFILDSDGVVSESIDMAERVRSDFISGARSWNTDATLGKRSTIHMQSCLTSDCTECTEHDSDFTQNFCLNVTNTQCVIVSDLDQAHLAFWNHANCNGNLSYWYNCGTSVISVSTPGTQSVGFQVGC